MDTPKTDTPPAPEQPEKAAPPIKPLNALSEHLIKAYEPKKDEAATKGGMRVNPIVSELASWYEKLRNAMEYHEEEVILRSAIERILKRRLILGGNGKTVALPLIRELIWARYFPDGSMQESVIEKVSKTIDVYLKLREIVILSKTVKEHQMNEWIFEVLSSHIEELLNPHPERESMVNYMFHILRDNITIADDTEETRDVQVFIAIRKAYSKNDRAFLRFHLFHQFFGNFNEETVETIAQEFAQGYQAIEHHLTYPSRFRILSYIKKQTPPFLILDDVLMTHRDNPKSSIEQEDKLSEDVFAASQKRYKNIAAKVRNAIIRSVFFLLFSKAIFAFLIEGSYERFFYGEVQWANIIITIAVPPLLMILAGITIRIPDKKNSERILSRIKSVLFDPHPEVGTPIQVRHIAPKTKSVMDVILAILWFTAFIVSFGGVYYILSQLHFNLASQAVFMFFLAVVAFLAYRINRTAHIYSVDEKQGFTTPIVDILFLPVAQVGRNLTDGISQINILLFLLDFVIEAPFKAIFGFFEQMFGYFHTKREYLE